MCKHYIYICCDCDCIYERNTKNCEEFLNQKLCVKSETQSFIWICLPCHTAASLEEDLHID
jgi:hypothetical protein